MKLIIASDLTEPPSEISTFRDVTLFAKAFIFEDILVRCKPGTRTVYWDWLKKHGAHDYISYLIREDEKESGFIMASNKANLNIERICTENLSFIINCLRSI